MNFEFLESDARELIKQQIYDQTNSHEVDFSSLRLFQSHIMEWIEPFEFTEDDLK